MVSHDNVLQNVFPKKWLIVKGDLGKYNRNYFGSVTSHLALRLFLIWSAQAGFVPILNLDTSSVFIHSRLPAYVHIQLPLMHLARIRLNRNTVYWRARWPIKGPNEAPSVRNIAIDVFLRLLVLKQISSEPCSSVCCTEERLFGELKSTKSKWTRRIFLSKTCYDNSFFYCMLMISLLQKLPPKWIGSKRKCKHSLKSKQNVA